MKKIVFTILALLVGSTVFSQQILEWSIGEAKVTCGVPVKVSYPLLVSISDGNNSPVLGTSTMRFIYDAGVLNNFTVQNIQNGYSISGLNQSNPVLGEIFGFTNSKGVFVQFDIMDNARSNPMFLSSSPTHVMDFSFEIDSEAKYPLCTAFVLDNNPDGWSQGIQKDDGFFPGSAGIVGSYFLNQDFTEVLQADDEVINLSWKKSKILLKSNKPIGKIEKGKNIGQINKSLCIKTNICKGSDCDNDGIPDSQELDSDGDGTPDDCENVKPGKGNENVKPGKGNENKSDIIFQTLFTVYPVPFDQEVTVEYAFDYDTDVTIEIYDVKGTLIKRIENNNYDKVNQHKEKIDLSQVVTQMLLVRLITNRNIETKKIVAVDTKRSKY